ncbi:hypothetical protein [Sphingomonas sp. Leaf17]|uniref:hypothetical protein n=1 Tax=Sphingomonas sp. Leaf17 TaxID=1735683 RepID=UPI000AC8BD2E|nr:hypothetical protein [Sphingomonas sp. Leaf17]
MRIAISVPPMLAAAITLAACAPTAEQRARMASDDAAAQTQLAKKLAGLVPGPSSACLPPIRATQVEAYGPTLLYTVSRGLKYRSDTNGGCESLARGDILVTVSNGSGVCQGDLARTVDRVARFTTGGCAIGPFIPYRKP